MKLSEIKLNPNNPRVIKDDKFAKLVKSITEFPKMMALRPIVVNNDNVVLGGNMRLKALKEIGYKDIPDKWVKRAEDLTDEEQRRFIIADNVGFGEHDWEVLANEWDSVELGEWGLDIPIENEVNIDGLFDIEIPFYEASNIIPNIKELADTTEVDELINKIEKLEIENDLKNILKIRASFFADFNFQKIADFYHHSNEEIKLIFEDLGMVILAPKKALEKGFIEISENIMDL